jgi:hypothetical protein
MSAQAERPRWLRAAVWATIALLVGFIAFCGVWRLQGGRWMRVETPSMGQTAPVGTLLWIKPVPFDSLKVGDFITFHPPGHGTTTYSHRVYRVNPDHTITTKGVIPAPDPWRLTSADVVGEVQMRWWGAGWLVAAAPILIVGFFVVAAIRTAVARAWKLPATILLASFVVTIAIVWLRPFVNAQQLAFAPDSHGGAVATYVGTGLLPIRLRAHGGDTQGSSLGSSVVMRDGQLGTIRVTRPDAQHKLRVDLGPAVPWWVWAGIVVVCFLPALCSLLIGFKPLPVESDPDA